MITIIKHRSDTYKNWKISNPVGYENEIIIVTELPWYLSCFGLKPTRLKVGDGKTPFNKLKFV